MKKDRIQGILFIISAGLFFSLMTFFVRLAGDLPTMQKAFFRNAVAAVVSVVMVARSGEGFHIQKSSRGGLAARCLFGTMGLICNFYAIDKLGLADANMLNKMSPFFAFVTSAVLLKEKPNLVEWAAVVIAFVGAMFIIRPSANIASVYGFIGLLGGFGAGVAYSFVRKLGQQGERKTVIVMCFSLFSSAVTLPFFVLQYEPMSWGQTAWLLLAGMSATGGQLCITAAYQKAPAKEISVFDYSQIIFAAALGLLFLHEIPDMVSVIGYIIIIGVAVFKWAYNLKQR